MNKTVGNSNMLEYKSIAKSINRHCLCKTFDRDSLLSNLTHMPSIKQLLEDRTGIFSDTTIYISRDDHQEMVSLIHAIENVIHSEQFQKRVTHDFNAGTEGVFMGYDFHMTEDGPKLIEINTNAGGAYLNLLLTNAQIACCEEMKTDFNASRVEEDFYNTFLTEFGKVHAGELPTTIAIMDEKPEKQFLYPEFQLFRDLFAKKGLNAFIVDPENLTYKNQSVYFNDSKIDIIYNRSTDFYLKNDNLKNLKEAWLNKKVVLTPDPRHHALYANKENLELLTDENELKKFETSPEDIKLLLKGIPKTTRITEENRSQFWEQRKNYFFKPSSGYGSKAAYRGDKITHKVWNEMKTGNYVAQELTPPTIRLIEKNGEQIELKHDVRVYTYAGRILLMAARLYSGQTTNFRTEGGGFAPVFIV